MAPPSVFGRDDDEQPPPPNEGVRVLGADEVAEVAERTETAKRRGPDEKKYGDRPEPPPDDVKPAMRFPLADSADPSDLERPRPAPVTPPTADDPTGSRPVLSVGPPTGETQLPHWTEPATGEVPKVLIGDDGELDLDENWTAFAASSPRWKDEHSDWDEDENPFDFVHTDETRIGALDETERPMDEEFLTFDDLEVPDAAPPQAPPRGTAADPIKIQRSGRAPLPTAPARPARTRVTIGAGEAGVAGGGGSSASGSPAAPARDEREAVRMGVVIAGVCLAIFLAGAWIQWVPLLLIAALVYFALKELYDATTRAGFRPLIPIGMLAAVVLPFAAYNAPSGESGMMLVLALTFAAMCVTFLIGAGKGRVVANAAVSFGGVFYVGALGGAYAALIVRSGPWANQPTGGTNQGIWYFILIAFGTAMCDVGGYLLGSRIGKTPLSAASPNKTREGLAAGIVVSVVCVLVAAFLMARFDVGVPTMLDAFILGLVVAVVAPIGDLVESMIKRDLGVKDMGSVLPGHGGVLDRMDAFLFTLPAAYYTLTVLGLIA